MNFQEGRDVLKSGAREYANWTLEDFLELEERGIVTRKLHAPSGRTAG